MSRIITNDQKYEIEDLSNNGHSDALIAYGADMYHDGILKGEVIGVLLPILGFTIYKIINKAYNKNKR